MPVSVFMYFQNFLKDTTDRNRTSPFAFTGNKFEFRMVGSTASISGPNIVLNTAVAEELKQFADILEGADDFETALHDLIKKTIKDHKRIIFNGNGYDDAWLAEAQKRGLLNLRTTPDALPYYKIQKNLDLFASHKVFSEEEVLARYEIKMELYSKTLNIEALTMVDMARKDILPAASTYAKKLSDTALAKKELGLDIAGTYEFESLKQVSDLTSAILENTKALEKALVAAKDISDFEQEAFFYRDEIFPAMTALRAVVDELEGIVDAKVWPYPSYGKLLFGII